MAKEINKELLEKACTASSVKARLLNKKAGLNTYEIQDDRVVKISPDGKEEDIQKAKFSSVKVGKRKFKI